MDVCVVGASGYVGGELLKILANHPKVDKITAISKNYAGKKIVSVHPFLNLDGVFESGNIDGDVIFTATPSGVAMDIAKEYFGTGLIVDLSADFRIENIQTFEKYYGKHSCPELVEDAVYGLPEINKKKIKNAKLIANPGCYPTSVILGLAPIIDKIKGIVVIDSKSGTSGGGKKLCSFLHSSEVVNNVKCYGIPNHRHVPEMEQELTKLANKKINVSFAPHLIPIFRGIVSTVRAESDHHCLGRYTHFYTKKPFIRVLEKLPDLKGVLHTNFCDIGYEYDERVGMATIVVAIDNLIKGAAGQAVQNMNIALGFEETYGLMHK